MWRNENIINIKLIISLSCHEFYCQVITIKEITDKSLI